GTDTLQVLTSQTDGAAALTAAQVDGWQKRLAADFQGHYVVGFQPAHSDVGTFHPVQVKVRGSGATVHARSGYWTADAEELLAARLAVAAAAPKPPSEPPLHPSRLIQPWFGQARGENGNMRITFVWQPAERVPGDLTRVRPAAVVTVNALKNGATVFEGRVK